jgi:hypothetical protein
MLLEAEGRNQETRYPNRLAKSRTAASSNRETDSFIPETFRTIVRSIRFIFSKSKAPPKKATAAAARQIRKNSGRRFLLFLSRKPERDVERANADEARQDEDDRQNSEYDRGRPGQLFCEIENRHNGGQDEPDDPID